MDECQRKLAREKDNNKELENNILIDERNLASVREQISIKETARSALEGEVAIIQNQLSAFASDLANKRAFVSNLNTELERRMQRLELAKKKYKATKDRLTMEQAAKDNLEASNQNAVSGFKEAEGMLSAVDKDIRLQKEDLFKES